MAVVNQVLIGSCIHLVMFDRTKKEQMNNFLYFTKLQKYSSYTVGDILFLTIPLVSKQLRSQRLRPLEQFWLNNLKIQQICLYPAKYFLYSQKTLNSLICFGDAVQKIKTFQKNHHNKLLKLFLITTFTVVQFIE